MKSDLEITTLLCASNILKPVCDSIKKYITYAYCHGVNEDEMKEFINNVLLAAKEGLDNLSYELIMDSTDVKYITKLRD